MPDLYCECVDGVLSVSVSVSEELQLLMKRFKGSCTSQFAVKVTIVSVNKQCLTNMSPRPPPLSAAPVG